MANNFVLLGDFDFQFDDPTCCDVKYISILLSDHSLTQFIRGPTHVRGHTLDWIVVRVNSSVAVPSSVNVKDLPFSEYKTFFYLSLSLKA